MLDKALVNRLGLGKPCAVHSGTLATPGEGASLEVKSPIDGSMLASFQQCTPTQLDAVLRGAQEAFLDWQLTPAPTRGLFVREFATVLREHKTDLARLVSIECGKILQEGLGEVQEMIDVCDYAVGLSRQLYGKTMPSERPEHRLAEQWHPLGPIGVISAFNFPVAVWSWNAAIAWVCGDPVVWKPSEKTPLCALACHHLALLAASRVPDVPSQVSNVVVGSKELGQALAASPILPLISATGSIPMGRSVAQTVAQRLGRSLLELGGNNAVVVAPSADLELALRAIVFAAAGTAGQRCTSLRRLIVHRDVRATLVNRLLKAFASLPVGDPLKEGTLVGREVAPDRDPQGVGRQPGGACWRRGDHGAVGHATDDGRGPGTGSYRHRRRASHSRSAGERGVRSASPSRIRCVPQPASRPGEAGNICSARARAHLRPVRAGNRTEQCGPSGAKLGNLYDECTRGRAVLVSDWV